MKSIYIIRHGETELNRKRIIQGSGIDSSLNDKGRAQARAFFDYYREIPFEAVLTSKLKRTHETIAPFLEQRDLSWEQFEALNEISWGIHEGLSGSPELNADYDRIVTHWKNGNYEVGMEKGETAAQLGERLSRFIDHLHERPESSLLICSHGRAMRAFMCLLAGEPLAHMDKYRHANTGLYQVELKKDTFRFILENDLSHLNGKILE